LIAEFKDGGVATRPSSNPAWNGGAAAGNGAHTQNSVPADEESAALPKRTARKAKSAVRSYGIATILVAVALGLTVLVRDVLPYPFLYLFFAAVMASAWLGGTLVGLYSVVLSAIVVAYYIVPPFDKFWMTAEDAEYFSVFVICVLVASWVSSSKKKTEDALTDARDLLEYRVAERTTELRKSNEELRHSIEEHRKAQQALLTTQADLAHLSRVFTMGELTTSIAHEVNQPLTAVVTQGHACVEWLSAQPPDLSEARESAQRIIQDGTRAGRILGHIRSLVKKDVPQRDMLNMNEVVQELTDFLRGEAQVQKVKLKTDLDAELPRVRGDRVQLQQVVLNLIMNGMDAMQDLNGKGAEKEIWIRTRRDLEARGVRISVEDGGIGLSPEIADKIFQPFFTTKEQGIGMGLSISRTIVESHAGHLWATPGAERGAVFQFTIPIES
jgi:C4-dicarboxylate-specific signal transduction histidine kinase